jgi:PKD repeat protein/glucose/arabinose dehydrogenase/type 1 glutamine amidotransferase
MKTMLATALLTLGLAGTAQAQDAKVLVFHGPPDATTTAGVAALKAIGDANDLTVDEAEDATDINAANLENYRALVFLNTAGNLLNAEQEGAVERFMKDGNGFLGIGSAAQGESGAFFTGLIGARPAPGGSTETSEQLVVPGDRVHPATRTLPLKWTRSDAWYTWSSQITGKLHVLARYRATDAAAGDATEADDNDTPISWCRDYGGGRSFYTGMGRTAAAFGEDDFRTHLTGALRWAAGVIRGDCKATIYANYKGTKIMSAGAESTGLATSGESHGIATANNGWILYIGRGDCRTDAERGALLNLPAFARTLDHADANVGVGCGTVHILDPSQADGTPNSGVTRAGTLAVYGDGGQGGEKTSDNDHKMEYGLLGIAPSPDFATTGHIYLQYFPTFNPNTKPAGLPVERRISKMSQPRISRFTINLQTKKLDLDSEVRIFQYDAQIYSCCHVGGGMGFDSKGNLYVTTGDTNSSQGSNGYSGNNPKAKCPIGPADEASRMHCGTANYSYQDARRTAGNTNDYNGKMLRIHPDPTIPDGDERPVGEGSTYSIPGADAPNGPNLFSGTETGCKDPEATSCTKREIYAMGLRNPSRLSIDPKTDIPYAAWVGPDAGSPSVTQGPSTYENAAQITHAGNYGWPYCMGNKQAYRDRPVDENLRTDSPPGYVPGGPASGGTEGWYDCDNLHNDSPNNTGLVVFPHETGTGADAGKVRGNNLWYSRGNKEGHNGCPDFERPRGATAAPNYDAVPRELCPYAEDDGMTIMDGPVYRYTPGADNSKRWPEYWDGRWFLHNNGGPSIKHGLLLDPATADQGGQPIYADSLRDMLTWEDGSYMDSKFGPDGALYVQTYDGFFRAGPNVSIYRYDYTGGAPTPSAGPVAIPVGDNEVKFRRAASGGVSWEWDFGDGETSTEPNPVHRYGEAKQYAVKLTVTYADGSKDSSSTTVDVIAAKDTAAPTTTAAFNPAQPGDGGTYNRVVEVALTAADAAGGSGVDRIEYRVDEGPWLTYGGPIEQSRPGAYTIEFRATDQAGNVEAVKSVSFTIALPENCPTNLNDEFDGPTLDEKWEIKRDEPTWRAFDDGRLRVTVRDGDMIGDTATAKNVLLQDAPDGDWQATTRFDASTLTAEGDQAGFVLWNGEDPNTFAKITYISKGSYAQFEWVATREDEADIHGGATRFAPAEGDVYLRLSTNGDGKYIAEGSTDGDHYTQISDPIDDIGDPKTVKVGVKVSNRQDSTSRNAGFDYFRVDCADRIAPKTTATLDKETPEGELGWYSSSPEVTLESDDGAGDGVAKTEYRIDGGAAQPYSEPIKIDTDGEHTIEYFATDKNGNVEEAQTVEFRVDGTAPKTTAAVAPGATTANVTLSAGDGTGSGVASTEYRVDGGPWTTYQSSDERILDGSEATFDLWKQTGAGRFERLHDGSGAITPVGGLGMLWYPVRTYGDFKLKLQFRDGRTDGGYSNGGVFIRFPNPEQDPRTDACAKTGSAANDDAWVAIYCGHEIQLWDGGDSEPQKTGSVYNFDPVDKGDDSKKGEWEDYEVEVRGQTFTIRRNGEVINEFENEPGLDSSRGGDPSTTLRQFTEGYIGLQNHSDADLMQYRNVRVEDLSAGGSVAGKPFTVSGVGPHTVEVRSVDAAGHVEDKQSVSFELGSQTPEGSTNVPLTQQTISPTIPPMTQAAATATFGRVSSRISRATFAKRGIRVPIACTGAMDGTAKLTVSRSVARKLKLSRTTLASADAKCWGPHSIKVSLKPSKALRKALARKGGPKRVKLTLRVEMRVFGKSPQRYKKTITLKR